jgi:hypothetical protein
VAIEHRLGDIVTQSLDTLVPNAYLVTGQQIVPLIRPSSSIYGPILAGPNLVEKIEERVPLKQY